MFGKKMRELKNDPGKALDYADNKLNQGVGGLLNRMVLGKDSVQDVNAAMQAGREAIEMQKAYQSPELNGLPATAEVVSIQDTGKTINFDPVVVMHLKVQPQYEPAYETTAETIVPRIAVPRPGDTLHIRYAPAEHSKIVIDRGNQ